MKQSIRDEIVLIEALHRGSQRSFEQLYANYTDFVYKSIDRIIRSKDDAYELTNDIFMKVWHNRDKIDSSQPMKNYLLLLAQREAYNFLNSKSAGKTNANIRMDDYLTELSEFIDLTDSENTLYAKELAMTIRLVVDRMPAQRRIIFEQSRYEGLSNMQIALNMDLSIKTIETHISAALRDLKRVVLAFCILYSSAHFLKAASDIRDFNNQPSINIIQAFEGKEEEKPS
ncbi:RNA polymerase sigma-70 factor (ECF subfamily) [Dysgonomonas alginatilytica]|uniref:RNA polymerase sigma-70 factor (ECF subfamily) n=1 Tax=Dysgonomonas alginatilytica TaxID=1605892 RepID=A0A2V3PII1_9BACT|nr:RNA polymerase sigma-70 factor [Dysgonomonas alginatilytica]PXV59433.1 RNA polymerase sigma-70 factor (ECF subfamily) [Dysgonomonas alginatilytica]